MSNNAITTLTLWSPDPAALAAVRAHAAGPPVRFGRTVRERPFCLEAVVPTGMDVNAWDWERATALWGCGRPETESTLQEQDVERVVYEVVTAYAPPDVALRVLSGAHPAVVVHAATTCEGEYASTAWFVRGEAVDERELGLDLSDEELGEWDGEWELPGDWAFDATTARRLAGGAAADG